MTDVKNILFVLDHFYPYIWWGETLFFELTRWLVKKGHCVSVVTSRYLPSLANEEEIDGVKVYRVWCNRIDFQRWGFQKAFQIIKNAKNTKGKKIDIIHASTFFSIIPGRLLRLTTGVKTVLTVHEIYGKLWFQFLGVMGLVNYLYEWFCMNLLRFDAYLCVSNYTKNCLRVSYGVPDQKLRTVYNGIDYDFWDVSKVDQEHCISLKKEHYLKESFVGLYFGRMGVAKWMNDVLSALPNIIKAIPHYKQVFITPKNQAKRILGLKNSFSMEEIEHYINKHHLKDHIIWIESVPRTDLRDRIALSDVVILPSRAEGFGFAVSEVCTLEGSIVTTNVASIPEVVYGKVWFVEPGNAQDIVDKVVDFSNGKYDIIWKRRFEWGDCVGLMESVYMSLS